MQSLVGPRASLPPNPLFLHGPAGCGKTHLISALVTEATSGQGDLTVSVLAAGDFLSAGHQEDELPTAIESARNADLLVLEDLHGLPGRAAGMVSALLDHCLAHARPVVLTANEGPGRLSHLSLRLTSRLGGGLVVALLPLSASSRLTYLQARLASRGLMLEDEASRWLATHMDGSARQLDGAVTRVASLTRLHGRPPTLEEIVAHFHDEACSRRLSVERIASRVGEYFRVKLAALRSRRRSRDALLPRQVGMYLARQLTQLSLQQIGAFFGGRDHSTVLHACRKVEESLHRDLALSGAVRRLLAEVA